MHFYSEYSNNVKCYQEGKGKSRFKKDLVQLLLITVLIHYLTRHGSSKIFLSLVFIFHTCRMFCEVNNRLSSRQMWDKSGPTSNGDKPCHARTQLQKFYFLASLWLPCQMFRREVQMSSVPNMAKTLWAIGWRQVLRS